MARASRGPVGLVLLVLAVVALTAIALVPRGVVRAVAVGQLAEVVGTEQPVGVNDDTTRAVHHLPGVRAVVSKEEQDPSEALLENLLGVELVGAAPPAQHPAGAVGETAARPGSPDRSARSERGPPAPI